MNTSVKTPQAQQQVTVAQPQQAAQIPATTSAPAMKDLVNMPIEQAISALGTQFANALPAHIPMERFRRVVMTAISSNPDLAKADRRSLFNSAVKAAQDGLLPDGREGALVIYNTKVKDNGQEHWIKMVQWMPMIAGIRKKVRNSGEILTWDTHVVYANDKFDYQLGLDPNLYHKPLLQGDRGNAIAAYSVAKLKSGEQSFEVMTADEIMGVWSKASKNKTKDGQPSGPWKDWQSEMFRKTVARRHSKVLPMSTDLDDLIRRDDALYDFDGASDDKGTPPADDMPRRPQPTDYTDVQVPQDESRQQAETVDQETGEVMAAQGEGPTDDEPGEFGAFEAREEGRKARDANKPLSSIPPGINQLNLADAYQEGWRDRDQEIAEAAKELRRAKDGG